MFVSNEGIPENCILRSQLKLLRLVCMWPVEGHSRLERWRVQLYALGITSCLALCTAGLISKAAKTSDLVDRSEAIDIVTLTVCARVIPKRYIYTYMYVFFQGTGVLKLLYFAYNQGTMGRLVEMMDNDFPKGYGTDQTFMKRWMRWCGPLSLTHCGAAFLLISFWGFCPLLNLFFGVITFKEMPLPMNVWYPWSTTTDSPQFGALYILHYLGLIFATQVYISCDGFFFSIIFFVLGQIHILKLALRGIRDQRPNGNETEEEAKYNALKRCVEHHNKILAFLKEVDLIFRLMIVGDVLHAVISLSFAMFQMSESKGVLETMKMVVFVAYCFLHQYLNSLFGQSLINQQESVMKELYSVEWIDRSHSFKRSLHIMMSNSVRAVKFSAWKMYYLQYETFVEFCRTMVSFFMVLRTLKYDK